MKESKKEGIGVRLLTLLFILIFVGFMIRAFQLRNYEYVYYLAIMIPLTFLVFLIHRDIDLHIPLFCFIFALFFMHACGGLLLFDGVRLYDMTFSFLKFDNIVHFFGGILLVFVFFNLIYKDIAFKGRRGDFYLFLIFTLIAMGSGTIIEIVEFLAVIFLDAGVGVGGYVNNATDLVVNMAGALVGSLIILKFHRKERFKKIIFGSD